MPACCHLISLGLFTAKQASKSVCLFKFISFNDTLSQNYAEGVQAYMLTR